MFQATIPQAITNIEKSEVTQKITQEKRANIQTQPLKQNDEVYIEKLIPKWTQTMKVHTL